MRVWWFVALVGICSSVACGSNPPPPYGGGGSAADYHGVGAQCSSNADCVEAGQTCLPFKGGYCGIEGCTSSTQCPNGSACVAYTDGHNYCFLICTDKSQCNLNRAPTVESNCSANITFVDNQKGAKACLPPT